MNQDPPVRRPSPQAPESAPPPEPGVPQSQQRRPVALRLSTGAPLVSYTFLVLTVLVFLAQILSETIFGNDLPALYGMKINSFILAGQWWRLLTPILLHGSILHIGFNMYALYVIGPGLESQFGHGRFLLVYLLSGFAGNVASMIFSDAPSLGASTSIFGLIGAQAVFLYQNRELFGERAQAALRSIVMIAVINLIIGLQPQIDNWGHIGGLVGGLAFSFLAGPILRVEGIYPAYALSDQRGTGDTILASALVGGGFAILAIGAVLIGLV